MPEILSRQWLPVKQSSTHQPTHTNQPTNQPTPINQHQSTNQPTNPHQSTNQLTTQLTIHQHSNQQRR
jgi:hypothetical protein